MATIAFNSPISKPLYGFGGVEVIGGKIASPLRKRTLNDANTFEITQLAAQHVASGVGSADPAVDIGNGHCGEPILAMAPGWASRVVDPSSVVAGTDALGVRIDHGAGVWSEYWHFNAWSIPDIGAYVKAGDRIGYLGSTGLGGVCHCHIEIKVGGRAIDPEPYVFGATLTILQKEEEMLTALGWTHIVNRQTELTVGSNFRDGPSMDSQVIKVFGKGTRLVPIGDVRGEAVGSSDRWLVCAVWVDQTSDGVALSRTVVGFFHTSVVGPLVPIEGSGITEEVAKDRETRAAALAARFVLGGAQKAAESFTS